MLTVAVSSRALFNIEKGHALFKEKGGDAFDAYMTKNKNKPLTPGIAYLLVRKLLSLNTKVGVNRDKVQIVLLSSNSTAAGMRVMSSIAHHGLDIDRAVFTCGSERNRYAKALGVHLFLSANPAETVKAVALGVPAATILPTAPFLQEHADIRVAFDGDAVLFSADSDEICHAKGLEAFREHEQRNANVPLGEGPMKPFLAELAILKSEGYPIRTALVTARGVSAHERALRTLESWGLHTDETILADGAPKGPILEAFGADLFFDDSHQHVDNARQYVVAGHVPNGRGAGIDLPGQH